MPNLIDEQKDVSIESLSNWILVLAIFSVIAAIGNYVGYEHPYPILW